MSRIKDVFKILGYNSGGFGIYFATSLKVFGNDVTIGTHYDKKTGLGCNVHKTTDEEGHEGYVVETFKPKEKKNPNN